MSDKALRPPKPPRRELVKCDDCEGDGWLWRERAVGIGDCNCQSWADHASENCASGVMVDAHWDECRDCEGVGKVVN